MEQNIMEDDQRWVQSEQEKNDTDMTEHRMSLLETTERIEDVNESFFKMC